MLLWTASSCSEPLTSPSRPPHLKQGYLKCWPQWMGCYDLHWHQCCYQERKSVRKSSWKVTETNDCCRRGGRREVRCNRRCYRRHRHQHATLEPTWTCGASCGGRRSSVGMSPLLRLCHQRMSVDRASLCCETG